MLKVMLLYLHGRSVAKRTHLRRSRLNRADDMQNSAKPLLKLPGHSGVLCLGYGHQQVIVFSPRSSQLPQLLGRPSNLSKRFEVPRKGELIQRNSNTAPTLLSQVAGIA